MATRQVYGAWDRELVQTNPGPPPTFAPSNVFIDGPLAGLGPTGVGQKSPGLVRVSRVPITPSVMENWTMIGCSVRLSLLYMPLTSPTFATFGKLWAGLAINSQQTNQGGMTVSPLPFRKLPGQAQFPADLSTFDVVWTQDDDVLLGTYDVTSQPMPSSIIPSQVARTIMFPTPVPILPSSQLQMQLVLTPGVYGWANNLVCPEASWSLIYDDGHDRA